MCLNPCIISHATGVVYEVKIGQVCVCLVPATKVFLGLPLIFPKTLLGKYELCENRLCDSYTLLMGVMEFLTVTCMF